MGSARRVRAVCAGALFLLSNAATAAIEVVGDEACDRFAADIASFATCVDGKVTRAVDASPPTVASAHANAAPRKAAPGATPTRGVDAPAVEHAATLPRQR